MVLRFETGDNLDGLKLDFVDKVQSKHGFSSEEFEDGLRIKLDRDQLFHQGLDGQEVLPGLQGLADNAGVSGMARSRMEGVPYKEVLRIFSHGGSRNLSDSEIAHVQWLFSELVGMSPLDIVDIIDGAGGGAMYESHVGASTGRIKYGKGGLNLGVTSRDIVNSEIPHPLLTELIYTANRDMRILLMFLLAQAGVFNRGGVGTFEELLTALMVRLAPQNHAWLQQYLFSDPTGDGIARSFYDFARAIVPAERSDFLHMHVGRDSSSIAHFIDRLPLVGSDVNWSQELFIPESVYAPFNASSDVLHRGVNLLDENPEQVLLSARRLCQNLIWSTVTHRDEFEDLGQIPVIDGSKRNVAAIKAIFELFFRSGRIKTRPEDGNLRLDQFIRFRVRKDC